MSEMTKKTTPTTPTSDASENLTICYDNGKSCQNCPNDGQLMCRFDIKDTLLFVWPFLLMLGAITWGSVLAFRNQTLDWLGLGIFLVVYIGYMAIFFNWWESRILCSHCPFYVIDDSKTLKCYANYGFLKSAPYNPAPITKSQQIQFAIGATLLFAIPIVFLLIASEFLFAGIVGIFLVVFFVNTSATSCKKCPNFSCLLNRVPKEWRDEYLRRNPVMRKAWEDAGYHVEDQENS